MSNEYKDYCYDKVQDVLLDAGVIDQIEEICSTPYVERKYVHGWKNGQKVVFLVYMNNEGEWVFEYRESNL